MKNKQLETLLRLKNEIDSVMALQGHNSLEEALINNTEINKPKINEILNLIGEISDGSVKDHIDSIKKDINDVNTSRQESIQRIDELISGVNNIIDEAKAPYQTLREAIENTNTNVQINTSDNQINLIAERQSELSESTFKVKKGQTIQIQKEEPNNKMTHYLVEHNLGEEQFDFNVNSFNSLDKNHNLNDNMYHNATRAYYGEEMVTLNHEIINEFYDNGIYFYETKDYVVSTDKAVNPDDINKFMTGVYPDTLNSDCDNLYILFKHEYYMDVELWVENELYRVPKKYIYKTYSNSDFSSFYTNGDSMNNYIKLENKKIRMIKIEMSTRTNNKLHFKVLNVPEQSFVDTDSKRITLNEIRNLKSISADGHDKKFLLDINNTNYSFINKDYSLNQYDFLIDDYLRQYHLNNQDYEQLKESFKDMNLNEELLYNNFIINEKQDGSMSYRNLNVGNSVFYTEHDANGDYTALYNMHLYLRVNGSMPSFNLNRFENETFTYNYNGEEMILNKYIQRVSRNIFVFKLEFDENSYVKPDDIEEMYIRCYMDDDPTLRYGSDGYDTSYGDTRAGYSYINLDHQKLAEYGINFYSSSSYSSLKYLYTNRYESLYNQYEMFMFDANFKARTANGYRILDSVYQYYSVDYYTRFKFEVEERFSNYNNHNYFQFPLYFVVKMGQYDHSSYLTDAVEDTMIHIKEGNMFTDQEIFSDERNINQKHFKNKVRSKTINNNLLEAIKVKEVVTTGDFVRFSLSDNEDTLKVYNSNTNTMDIITDIYSDGMTKEELKSIPENILYNMNSITIKFVELENSEFSSITFETIGDRLIEVDSESDYYDFGFTIGNIDQEIEKYYNDIEKLDDFNPEKDVRLKVVMDNIYKNRGYYLGESYLDTFESSYLESPTIDELTKIRIRDFKHYYEFENLTNQDKVIKLYQNRHYNLNLIDQQSGNEISTILDNANALTNDELFKDKIINTLTADMRQNLLESVMAEVNTVNQSYAKEFTTEYFFDAAASKVYTLPITSQDIMLRVEKFITDNTINFDNRMMDVNIENYLSSNIQLNDSYYSNEVKYEEVEFLELPDFDGYTTKEIVISEDLNNIKNITEKEV